MDLTGLRVSIDATPAEQGKDQFNTALGSMASTAKTVTQQVQSDVSRMAGVVATGAQNVSQQVGRMASGTQSASMAMSRSLDQSVMAANTLEEAYAALEGQTLAVRDALLEMPGSQVLGPGTGPITSQIEAEQGLVAAAEAGAGALDLQAKAQQTLAAETAAATLALREQSRLGQGSAVVPPPVITEEEVHRQLGFYQTGARGTNARLRSGENTPASENPFIAAMDQATRQPLVIPPQPIYDEEGYVEQLVDADTMKLYRGGLVPQGLTVGQTFTDRGYQSFTTHPHRASTFTDLASPEAGMEKAILRLEANAGDPMADVNSILGDKSREAEAEYVIGRNTPLRVNQISQDKSGRTIYDVSRIGQTAAITTPSVTEQVTGAPTSKIYKGVPAEVVDSVMAQGFQVGSPGPDGKKVASTYGPGVYATPNREVAAKFGDVIEGTVTGNIAQMTDDEYSAMWESKAYKEYAASRTQPGQKPKYNAFTSEMLQQQGYAGLHIPDAASGPTTLVFDPKSIDIPRSSQRVESLAESAATPPRPVAAGASVEQAIQQAASTATQNRTAAPEAQAVPSRAAVAGDDGANQRAEASHKVTTAVAEEDAALEKTATVTQQVATATTEAVRPMDAMSQASARVVAAEHELESATQQARTARRNLADAEQQLAGASEESGQKQQILGEYQQTAIDSTTRLTKAKQELRDAQKEADQAAKGAAAPAASSVTQGVSGAAGVASDAVAAARTQEAESTTAQEAAYQRLAAAYEQVNAAAAPTLEMQTALNEAQTAAVAADQELIASKRNLADAMSFEAAVADTATVSVESMNAAQNAGTGAGTGFTTSQRAVSGVLQEINGRVPIRAFERWIAMLPGAGALLEAAFPVIGMLAAGMVLVQLIDHLEEMRKKALEAGDAMASAMMKANSESQAQTQQLRIQADELENQIAKLEHRPQSGLKIAIDESKLSLDEMNQSLAESLDKVEQLTKGKGIGILGSILSDIPGMFTGEGVATSTKYEGVTKSYDLDFQRIQQQHFQDLQNANTSNDPKQIAAAEQRLQSALNTQLTTKVLPDLQPRIDALSKAQETYERIQPTEHRAPNRNDFSPADFAQMQKYGIDVTRSNLSGLSILQTAVGQFQGTIDKTGQQVRVANDRAQLRALQAAKPVRDPLSEALESLDTKAMFAGQLAAAQAQGPGAVSDVMARQQADLEVQKLRTQGLRGTYDETTGKASGQAAKVVSDLTEIRDQEQLGKETQFYRENSTEIAFNTKAQVGLLDVIKQGPAAVQEYMRQKQLENAITKEGEGITGAAAEAFQRNAAALRDQAKAEAEATLAAQRAQATWTEQHRMLLETAATRSLIAGQRQSSSAVTTAQVTSSVKSWADQNNISLESQEYKLTLEQALALQDLQDAAKTAQSVIADTDPIRAYTDRLDDLKSALDEGAISYAQFARAASDAYDQEVQGAERALMATKTGVAGIQAALLEIQQDSRDMASATNAATMQAYEGITKNLSNMITAQKTNWQQTFEQVEGSVTEGIMKKYVTGPIFGELGKVLNVPGLGPKADGSESNPYWVRFWTGTGTGIPGLHIPGTAGGVLGTGQTPTWTGDPLGKGIEWAASKFGLGSLFGGGGAGQQPTGTPNDPIYVAPANGGMFGSGPNELQSLFGGGNSSSSGGGFNFMSIFSSIFGGGAGGGGDMSADWSGMADIGTFADGGVNRSRPGITRSPSMFTTSEFNHAEAIVPLPDGNSIPVIMSGGGNGGGGGGVMPMTVKLVDGTTRKVQATPSDPKWDEQLKQYVTQIYLEDAQTNGKMSQLRSSERMS